MTLEGEKQLMKQFTHLHGTTANSGIDWIFQPAMPEGQGKWKVNHYGTDSWIWTQSYFDLAGLKTEELSTQVLAVALQKPYEPVIWKGLFGDLDIWPNYVQLYAYISDVPILGDDVPADIEAFAQSANFGTYPSFSTFEAAETGPPLNQDYQHSISWQNLIYAEQTMYSSNSNADATYLKVPLYTRLYGSGNATASDRLYVTLIWRIGDYSALTDQLGEFYLPPLRIVAGVEVFKEKDMAYIERMRRSYVEQQGFDNDGP